MKEKYTFDFNVFLLDLSLGTGAFYMRHLNRYNKINFC